MRTIDHIVIHCSATREDRSLTVAELEENHRCRGFRGIGYHYYIRKDGTVINTRALELVGAHAKGHNSHSIGICYVGGLDANGKPADTRTPEQKAALRDLVAKLCKEYPIIELLGHRDTSPDLDGSGEVEPAEYIKACPCFDVRSEFSNFLRNVVIRP